MKSKYWILAFGSIVATCAHADQPRNPSEHEAIAKARAAYARQGLEFTQQREDEFLVKFRQAEANAIDAQVMMQSNPGGTNSPAAALRMLQQLRQNSQLPQNAQGASVPAEPVDAGAIAAEIEKRHAQGAPTVFTPRKDGFLFDGKPFVDTAGTILSFGGDSTNGDVSYLETSPSSILMLKYTNVHSTLPPVLIGQIIGAGTANMTFNGMGTAIQGDTMIPAGRKLVVARGSSVFVYTFGGETKTLAFPADYRLAPYQRGDVSSTGFVLLRRDISNQERSNPITGLASIFKEAVGKSDDKDYALFSTQTGHTDFLNISESGEQVGHGTNCTRQNKFVNKCSGWVSQEALYDGMGMHNDRHYFWRIAWMPSNDGPTAVLIENGMNDLDVIRLDTGEVAHAFHRVLGIQSFDAEPTPSGSIKIIGNWMLRQHPIDDVRTLFAQNTKPAPGD